MEKKLNIAQYLDNVGEDYSGYYGSDYASDLDAGYGNEFAPAEGVEADMPAPVTPSPYQVTVANTTAGTLTVVLFGKNEFLLSTNFGSSVGITVTPSQSNVTYIQLLNQSAEQPFETSLIRVQSANATQVTQILTITSIDANGQECTVPLITQSYFSANQFQSGIIDVPYSVRIDGNTNIQSPVLAGATVVYTFFPASKVNPSRALGKRPVGALKDYAAPQVPIISPSYPASYPRPMRSQV
jgi:hypothetical protein